MVVVEIELVAVLAATGSSVIVPLLTITPDDPVELLSFAVVTLSVNKTPVELELLLLILSPVELDELLLIWCPAELLEELLLTADPVELDELEGVKTGIR